MPQHVSIDIETLCEIRDALLEFKSNTAGLSHRTVRLCDEISSECIDKLRKFQANIDATEREIETLKKKISEFDYKIYTLEVQISSLESLIISLQAKLRACADDKERALILAEISRTQAKLNALREKKFLLEAQKGKLEEELQRLLKVYNTLVNQFREMQSLYYKLDSDMKIYLDAVKNFTSASETSSQENITALDFCIEYIEDYIAVYL